MFVCLELRREIWVQEVHLGIVMRIVLEAMGFNDVTGGRRSQQREGFYRLDLKELQGLKDRKEDGDGKEDREGTARYVRKLVYVTETKGRALKQGNRKQCQVLVRGQVRWGLKMLIGFSNMAALATHFRFNF